MARKFYTLDGNEAAAYVAYRCSDVLAIYPITPSSPMGEFSDEWSAVGVKNIWGTIPSIQEMQSEAGAAGAVHGALQAGAMTTTFTASQGLLLKIPNMYKIAGELTPAVFHVSARSLAAQALSIFGDHSDVMSVRQTGFALVASVNVQECMDMALISYAATLKSRVPFLHFFDGFRTSHEVAKIELLDDADIKAMIDDDLVIAHRNRALTPDKPVLRGTAQNPDVYFQGRETVNPFYAQCPGIVQAEMDKFAKVVGRQYNLFDYYGPADAERVIIIMGSGAETTQTTVDYLAAKGEKVGVLKVRLYRPFSIKHFINAIPKTAKVLAVLDRTKEPGCAGEPLYQDVLNALFESQQDGALKSVPRVIGGRYGLSSKEFTPAMVKAVFDEMKKSNSKNHFTVGINDDVSHTSLEVDDSFIIEDPKSVCCLFYGLGADGTVGANKATIKIISENTPNYGQGYFVYDSKKSGSMTVSHLRFGANPIRAPYLIGKANFVACHQGIFLERYDMLKDAAEGAVFLLNTTSPKDQAWDSLPRVIQQHIIEKKLKFYVIDAYAVAGKTGMGGRINTIMQTCFFAISGVLPREEAIEQIKKSIQKAYGKKGEDVVQQNFKAVDETLANLHEVKVPAAVTSKMELKSPVSGNPTEFVKNVTAEIIAGRGDKLPVSKMPIDGTFPTGTTMYEKRCVALECPEWDLETCIQCGKCVMVCPHAVIRSKMISEEDLKGAPESFVTAAAKDKEFAGKKFRIQIAAEDCTGCGVCVSACPAKSKKDPTRKAINMTTIAPIRDREAKNWEFFFNLPDADRSKLKQGTVRGAQFLQPLFEFSGACAGCGETPYIKLVTQLFGDRAIIANATGCTSIYGGNLPTTPYTKNCAGRGPAWSNSLFEDNAEFGLGFRLSIDKKAEHASELLKKVEGKVGGELVNAILTAKQVDEADIFEQRKRVEELKKKLVGDTSFEAKHLLSLADYLVKKSVWVFGGDGWAYDIGFGGLDHVLAQGRNVNILVLDTEVYSNTGGQASKSTPRAAVAKFAASGKQMPKKDLARIIMTYGHVYVATVAVGAKDEHTVKAIMEAEKYPGASLIIAYSHCIAHGINMAQGLSQQKAAVETGHWPLFRYNPELIKEGKNPLTLDSSAPKMAFRDYAYGQTRFKSLTKSKPEEAERLIKLAQEDVNQKWAIYEAMAAQVTAAAKAVQPPQA
ncbi:MAG: pyruvate:ferredoxin (flavodoxin) oxidoreductase [Candidatus Omnitrophica bacterium]|nr:pyruvate:ferredoxin (flavodoxin) oxidoreductase [Candidatus Omnitrophota bacterium]